jgi:hypothetical protein
VRDNHLRRLERPIGGGEGGSGGYVYLAAGSRARIASPHTLDLCELFVRLVERQRAGAVLALEVAPEPFCHVLLDSVTLKPDLHVRLEIASGAYQYFVELDRGTEWRSQLVAKMRRYERAYERWTAPTFPLVLFLAPDELRCSFIRTAAGRLTRSSLFSVTTFDAAIGELVNVSEPRASRP